MYASIIVWNFHCLTVPLYESSTVLQSHCMTFSPYDNSTEQAGTELCQAQGKLGLSMLYLVRNYGHLPFKKTLMSSFICQKIEVVFHLAKNLGRLLFKNKLLFCPFAIKLDRLPFAAKLRSSSNSCDLTWSTFTEKCGKINFPVVVDWINETQPLS